MERTKIFLQKWRVRLGHLFGLIILVLSSPRVETLIAGTLISFFGEGIRIYSAGVIDKNVTLSRTGPYAYTRNPLYVGSFFMYLGFCVAAANVYVVAAFLVFFYVVYLATILREEEFLRGEFGEAYETFRRETPRFFPRPGTARPDGKASFSWARVKENKEYEGLVGAVIILAILWAAWLAGWSFIGWAAAS